MLGSPARVTRMQVVQSFIRAKNGRDESCEDVIVVTDAFTAVFDGATDVTDLQIDGVTGGRLAALTAAQALEDLDPTADVNAAVRHLSAALTARNLLEEPTPLRPGVDRPSTAMLVLSHARYELWRIGDSGFALDDRVDLPDKPVDRLAYGLRAAYLHALLAAGAAPDDLAMDDPGFALLRPFFVAQGALTNRPGPYGYGTLDGSAVPEPFIECIPVPRDARRLVLVTDGYPFIRATLAATERDLAALMARDPLGITEWPRPVALGPTLEAFDDRAWVELDLQA